MVVVAKEQRWGGMWPNAYSFVRLHQPYGGFTAGEREWAIRHQKPPERQNRKI